MGRLKGQDLANFFAKCTGYQKVGGTPRQIKFKHDTSNAGDKTYEIITRVYRDVLFGTMSGLNRKDWTFKTNTKEERDNMYEDLRECEAEYNALFGPEPSNQQPLGGGTGDDDDVKKKSDLTTYIIIGAAAAVIIALVIPWKK